MLNEGATATGVVLGLDERAVRERRRRSADFEAALV